LVPISSNGIGHGSTLTPSLSRELDG